jgi:RNA polymerase sigma-70 factor (ECF subfamily)
MVMRRILIPPRVNRFPASGVLPDDEPMHDQTARLAGSLVTVDQELEREFETRLVESATLAFRVAYGVLRHRQDAEDVAQEAFVKAYRNFRELRDRERFRAWLVRITWRLAIDRQRSDRRRLARENAAAPAGPAIDSAGHGRPAPGPGGIVEDLEARERAARLWSAIDALSEKLRVVLVLASIEGHDIGDVARLLNLPEGTVKSRLFLARQRLKELLQ